MIRTALELTLPWPPSVNAYWVAVGAGRAQMLTKTARMYRSEVAAAIRKSHGDAPLDMLRSPVRVDIELRPPDRRKRDIDNHIKGIFDALTHAGVWDDDSRVDEMTVRRGRVAGGGYAVVLIAALDQ